MAPEGLEELPNLPIIRRYRHSPKCRLSFEGRAPARPGVNLRSQWTFGDADRSGVVSSISNVHKPRDRYHYHRFEVYQPDVSKARGGDLRQAVLVARPRPSSTLFSAFRTLEGVNPPRTPHYKGFLDSYLHVYSRVVGPCGY
jgi:hypothetical protein